MNKPLAAETINEFLWGRLDDQSVSDFLDRLYCNKALQRELEKEIVFEAMFYSLSWNIQTAPGLERSSDWASLAAPQTIVEKEHDLEAHTALEWDNMVKGAFEKAFPLTIDKNKKSRIIPFPKVYRYLAAACIVGAIAGTALLFRSPGISKNNFSSANVVNDTTVPAKSSAMAMNKETPPVTSITFDSIVIYGPRSITGKPIHTETRDGIVRIGDRTAILLDKNSSVAVTSQSDSAVSIDLKSGGALFTVEKHRFNRFSVSTPACNIAVTGTIFRLAVEKDMTIVSVLEGSVRASRRNDTAMVAIKAGMSAHICPDTIMLENGDTAATLLYRSSILSDFLHENGVFENGMFVRSGIRGKTDTVSRQAPALEYNIDKEQQRAVDK